MSWITKLTRAGFALSALALAGSVQAGEPPPPSLAGKLQQAYCMSGYLDYNDPNAYFTPVFEVRVPQSAKPSYSEDLAKIYEAYLHSKYGYVRMGPLSVVCTFSVSAAAVQGGKEQVIKDTEYHHRKVVETGWKPSAEQIAAAAGAAAAPSAPAAPPTSAATTYYTFCTGTQEVRKYFSAMFTTEIQESSGQPDQQQNRLKSESLAKSYRAFLVARHAFSGTAECYLNPVQNSAEWTLGRLRGLALGRSVDTDWSPGT